MGKKGKKRAAQEMEELRPWCWYCDRDFEDEKVLINHQKAKHFRCPTCGKRMINAPGMVIHCAQVHKEELKEVPNSLPGRSTTKLMIMGTQGIPQADMDERIRKLGM